jgi:hypothetical protein
LVFPLLVLLMLPAAADRALAQTPASHEPAAQAGEGDKDRLIADLFRRVEALEQKLAQVPPPAAATETVPAQPATAERARHPAGQPADAQDMERALVRHGGLLLPPMSIELEPQRPPSTTPAARCSWLAAAASCSWPGTASWISSSRMPTTTSGAPTAA